MSTFMKSVTVLALAAMIGGCASATVIKETGQSRVIHEEPLTASDAGFQSK